MLTADQKRIVQSIIGVFETGKAGGDPSAVTVLKDGGGISFGLYQATDASDTLDAIIIAYRDLGGVHGAAIAAYLPRLAKNETAGAPGKAREPWVDELMALLAKAGREDPKMKAAEQAVFDRKFWVPCAAECEQAKLAYPLSWAIVYDTCIQSGPSMVTTMRRKFPELSPAAGGDERKWALAYLNTREKWLAEFVGRDADHTKSVRSTVYRTQGLRALANLDPWNLTPPIPVPLGRGTVVVS